MIRKVAEFPFFAHLRAVGAEMDPLEVMFLVVFIMSGSAQLVSGARPGSIDMVMPESARLIWLLMLLIGSVLSLSGIFYHGHKVTAMMIESVGLAWVSISLIIYGGAAIVAVSMSDQQVASGSLGGPMIIVLGIAFGWKRHRIQRLVNRLKT